MAASILKKIVKNKKAELKVKKEKMPVKELLKEIMKTPANRNFRDIFEYGNFLVIGEIKKKAPSMGKIRSAVNIKKKVKAYESAGVKAVSVVTDKKFFDGKPEYISEAKKYCGLPVLRKDFIIDEYQIYESRFLRADAVLLIASLLEKRELNSFVRKVRSLNMTPVVEAATKEEIKRAVSSGTDIIGINTRDLKTFKINPNRMKNLVKYVPKDKIVICESGVKKLEDLEKFMISPVIKGLLVGTMFMKSTDRQIKDFMSDAVYRYDIE